MGSGDAPLSFFVDANVLVYAATEGDSRREGSLEILRAISEAEAVGVTSTAVLEEVWHLELSRRVGGIDGLARRSLTIFRPLLAIDDEVLDIAFALEVEGDRLPGANDRVHAATCIRYGIDTIVSADRGFDAISQLRRVDPIDRDGLVDLW